MASGAISWKCSPSVTAYNNPSAASITPPIEMNRWTPTHAAAEGIEKALFPCADSYLLTVDAEEADADSEESEDSEESALGEALRLSGQRLIPLLYNVQ